MNPLDLIAPATRASRRQQKKAAEFQASIKPGHTYYSVVDLNARYPGAPRQALAEWTFSKPGRWIGQEPRCGHMTAAGTWLSAGPLYATRPARLMTFQELHDRPSLFAPGADTRDVDRALRSAKLTPAGV